MILGEDPENVLIQDQKLKNCCEITRPMVLDQTKSRDTEQLEVQNTLTVLFTTFHPTPCQGQQDMIHAYHGELHSIQIHLEQCLSSG